MKVNYPLQRMISDSAGMVLYRYSALINSNYDGKDLNDLDKYALYHLAGYLNHEIEGFENRVPTLLKNYEGKLTEQQKRNLEKQYKVSTGELKKHLEYLNSLIAGIKLTEEVKRDE